MFLGQIFSDDRLDAMKHCEQDLFIENGQNKAESYKIKIYNQFYSLKLFYLTISSIAGNFFPNGV